MKDATASQAEAALALLKRIRYHADRHALPREWLTAADEVLGTWGPVQTTHQEVADGVRGGYDKTFCAQTPMPSPMDSESEG